MRSEVRAVSRRRLSILLLLEMSGQASRKKMNGSACHPPRRPTRELWNTKLRIPAKADS